MTTYVIDLFAGPGAGKSTLAAKTFAQMKEEGESVELVREYVKDWAWRGEPVRRWDGPYLLAKQLRRESALYDKVDVIITDSPMLMTAIYEERFYPGSKMLFNLATDLLKQQEQERIIHIPCLVKRFKPYVPKGRFETQEQALDMDQRCKRFLDKHQVYNVVSNVNDILFVLQQVRELP